MTSSPPPASRRFGRQALTCSLLAGALAWLPPDGRDDSAGLIGAAYAAGPAAGEPGAVTPAAAAPGDGIDIGSVFDIVGAISAGVNALYYGLDKSYIDTYYGGNVGGYLLDMLLTGGDTEGAQLDYIVDQLKKMSETLDHLVKMDVAIEKEIAGLAQEINIDTKEVQISTALQVISTPLAALESYVGGNKKPTGYWLGNYTATAQPLAKNSTQKADINNTCKNDILGAGAPQQGNLASWMNAIYGAMQGPNGFIQLAGQQMEDLVVKGGNVYTQYQVMEAWTMKFILLQYKGLNFYVECAHALDYKQAEISQQYSQYLLNIVEQLQNFRNVAETLVIASDYNTVREAFSNVNASTTMLGLLGNMSPGALVVFRVDYLIDQVLGTTDLTALSSALNQSAALPLRWPAGMLTARALAAQASYADGYQLNFTPPAIASCPKGFERTALWTIANGSAGPLSIAWLNAWQKPNAGCDNTGYECFVPQPFAESPYYGSDLYQMAVAPLTVGPDKTGHVGLCAVASEAKQPDMSLFIDYRTTPANATDPGALKRIQWSGGGEIDQADPGFFVDGKTVTFGPEKDCPQCSPSYSGTGTGTAAELTGLPFMTWEGAKLTGSSAQYRMIRYGFPDVPLGQYQATDSAGTNLLSPPIDVVPYDRQFHQFWPGQGPDGAIRAHSQVQRAWESFVLEGYHPAPTTGDALGKLKAANGKYVVVDSDGQLVANSDTGQDIAFVEWTKTDMASDIINRGYLQFGAAGYVRVDPSTQTIGLVKTTRDATKLRITFVDKGKKALATGQNYQISLAYAVPDDEATSSCGDIGPAPPATCYTYYVYANVGYPYGYFGYAPVATTGGFGKSFGLGVAESPFGSWAFNGEELNCNPSGFSPNAAFGRTDHDGATVSVRITSSSKGGPTYACAEPWAYLQTSLFLADSACEYHFTVTMIATTIFDFTWNGASHDDLKTAESYLHFDRKMADNKFKTEGSASFQGNVPVSEPYVAKDIVYYADASTYATDNEAWIVYGAKLDYNAGVLGPGWDSPPTFSLNVGPETLQLNLAGITQNKNAAQGSCSVAQTD